MSLPRVVMVTRRFWPLVGGAETAMAGLAASFQARGAATTLLTARWKPEWPLTIEHRGVRVVRIAQPAKRFWGSARYMMRLAGWLDSVPPPPAADAGAGEGPPAGGRRDPSGG